MKKYSKYMIILTCLLFSTSLYSMKSTYEQKVSGIKKILNDRAKQGDRTALKDALAKIDRLDVLRDILEDTLIEKYYPGLVSAELPVVKPVSQPEPVKRIAGSIVGVYGSFRAEGLKLYASDDAIEKILAKLSGQISKKIVLASNINEIVQAETVILFVNAEGRYTDEIDQQLLQLAKSSAKKIIIGLGIAFNKSQAEESAKDLAKASKEIEKRYSNFGVLSFYLIRDASTAELFDIPSNNQQFDALVAALRR